MEDIIERKKRYSLISIINYMEGITTILLDEKNLSLVVGDGNGRVLQLSYDFQGNLGKIVKNYGDLGIGCIYSSCWVGDIAVFGGKKGKLAFINNKKREFMGYSFDLAPLYIDFIQFCWIHKKSQPKAFLVMTGEYYDYNGKTDVLDVTQFISKEMRYKKNQRMLTLKQENSETEEILNN